MERKVLAWKSPSREDSPGIPQPGPRGREGRKVSLPCQSAKSCHVPMQPQLPLVESEPQFLTKHTPKPGQWGESTFLTLLPTLQTSYAETSQLPSSPERPSGSRALFILFTQLHVLESCPHLSQILLLKHRTVDREVEDLASGQRSPTYPVMVPASCFSLPPFAHLREGKKQLIPNYFTQVSDKRRPGRQTPSEFLSSSTITNAYHCAHVSFQPQPPPPIPKAQEYGQ